MKINTFLLFISFIHACKFIEEKPQLLIEQSFPDTSKEAESLKSYDELKQEISKSRKYFSIKYNKILNSSTEIPEELINYWINTISNELYSQWQKTPWDFNGTTTEPKKGTIACGFFVTTLLRDMGMQINRTKLAVCPSSEMMKTLTPHQRLKNMSYVSYTNFNEKMKMKGKGVYIIGLDYHTGFIVNDGVYLWFIHSNYIERKGVTKEKVLSSSALKTSKTRWVVTLTGDVDFLQRWLK